MQFNRLTLLSSDISAQAEFYIKLGFSIVNRSEKEVHVQVGSTLLVFKEDEGEEHFYHFAFLIPSDRIDDAIEHCRKNDIKLLLNNGKVITDFGTGKAIYFFDRDGNIGEFIQRPSLGIEKQGPFSLDMIECVNEISLPAVDPLSKSKELIETFGIQTLPKEFNAKFNWVGDFRGVFLVVDVGRHWLPTEIPAIRSRIQVDFETTNGRFNKEFY